MLRDISTPLNLGLAVTILVALASGIYAGEQPAAPTKTPGATTSGAAIPAAAASTASANIATGDKVTFNKHIAPLVFQRCAGCHRPGEVAPFPLLTFRDVSKRAKQIETVVEHGVMPPWKPVAGQGEFSNGRRLSPNELGLIKQWVATGAVEGDAADLPPTPTFTSGWQRGTPDLVVTLPVPVQVPADGPDIYLNVVLPMEIPKGKYIKATEIRPGNRRVVHHAVLHYDTTGKARERDAEDAAPGFVSVTPPGKQFPGSLSIWTPGRFPLPLGDGLSMPWPEKADLILQLHLHPSGKPETEQSSIGFYFTDEAPRHALLDLMLIDTKIDIPPGEKAYRTHDESVIPIDVDAVSIFPHMHIIGKKITVKATLPDGTSVPLLAIDDWDFNWQDLYQYSSPIRLPKGTKVELECIHDNSAENPRNPKSPPNRVTWGEQTFNEMSIALIYMIPVQDRDLIELQSQPVASLRTTIVPDSIKPELDKAAANRKPPKPEDIAKRAQEAMKFLDKNSDGKLSADEIVAVVGNREPRAEIEKRITRFDKDGDNQLNAEELTAAMTALIKPKQP